MPDKFALRHPRFATYFVLGMATMMVFVLGIAAVQVRQIHTLTRKQTQEIAQRAAQNRAQKLDAVDKCFTQAAQGASAQRFFNVLDTTLEDQMSILRDHIALAEPSEVPQLRSHLRRTQQSLRDLRDFRAQTLAQIPERSECVRLAHGLDVKVPK